MRARADVTKRDKDGYTALEFAQEEGKREVVKLLLQGDANVSTADSHATCG